MKKVIIITISMLAIFSVLVGVSANQLTYRWQTPQQDEIELTTSSPVEMVEKEYKAIGEYSYISNEENNKMVSEKEQFYEKTNFEMEPKMITYEQVAYIGGSLLEQIFPKEEIYDKQFIIYGGYNLTGKKNFTGVYKENENDIISLHYVYKLDAYSGELMYLSRTKDKSMEKIVESNTQANEYAVRLINICGYNEYIDFSVNISKYYDGLLYQYDFKLDDNNVVNLQFDTYGKKLEIIMPELEDDSIIGG